MAKVRTGQLAAAVALGLLVAACGGVQSPSPTPLATLGTGQQSLAPQATSTTESPAAQLSAGPGSSVVPLPTAAALTYPRELDFANELAMRVTVAELNVRDSPSTAGKKLGTARKGAVFLVRNWPIQAGGFTWYFGYQAVLPADGAIPALPDPIAAGIDPLSGWLAAGTESSPYLQPIGPRCPENFDLQLMSGMLDSELLACFGSSSIEIEGTFGCGGCGDTNPGTFTPDWLANPGNFAFLSVNPESVVGPLALHVSPVVVPLPAPGSILSVQGHFDDPLAKTCAIAVPPNGNPDGAQASIAAAAAVAYCRTRFVVEYYEILGIDPSFSTG